MDERRPDGTFIRKPGTGPASGRPALGDKLVPAGPGNVRALKHGSYALIQLSREPRVTELAEQIMASQPVSHPADAGAVQRLALTYARIERAVAAIDQADSLVASDPVGAYSEQGNLWMDRLRGDLATWLRLAGQIEAELARTPASRAKLGLHLASAARQMTVVDLHEQAALEQVEREQAIEAEGVDVDHA